MLEELMMKMIEFDCGDPKRIQHFIKVHSFSKLIGEKEGLDAHTLFVLEAASILHDIGIRVSEEKYGFQNGKLQEQEGPTPAREICTSLGFKEDDIERKQEKERNVKRILGIYHKGTLQKEIIKGDY